MIESNRRNAARSTGPRSEESRRTSSQNAIKHGLARPHTLPAPEIEALARAVAGEDPSHERLVLAMRIAESVLELRRVRGAQVTHINKAIEVADKTRTAEPSAAAVVLSSALLARMDRYEQRALSRCRMMIRRLDSTI